MNKWGFLVLAIFAETVATTALKQSEGFSKLCPSIISIAGYSVSFYFLSIALKVIPVGVAYAIWSGLGVVLITTLGWLLYEQKLDYSTMIGMGLIVSGVVVINITVH